MGLRDIFNGMLNGPQGQRQPSSIGSGGGMSRIVMALLGLLAYKVLKGSGGQAAPTDPGARRRAAGSRIDRRPQWATLAAAPSPTSSPSSN